MKGKKVKFAILIVMIAMMLSMPTVIISGFLGGAGDGDKTPDGCSCHTTTHTCTVDISASATAVEPGASLDITVTVTGDAGVSDTIGMFLLKGPVGSSETIEGDGWTIISDPNGGQVSYVEMTGTVAGTPIDLTWSLTAPSSDGTYSLYADLRHGGGSAMYEESALITISVETPSTGSDPPVIMDPGPKDGVEIGATVDLSVKVTDDMEGVQWVKIFFKLPGDADFTEKDMMMTQGTAMDGDWGLSIDVGLDPGAFEFHIKASDGVKENRSPTSGSYSISVTTPGFPQIMAPTMPDKAEVQSTVRISVRMVDKEEGIQAATLFYKPPGSQLFSDVQMTLSDGTIFDGIWTQDLELSAQDGIMEVYFEASDGKQQVQAPSTGFYKVQVEKPEGPRITVDAPSISTVGEIIKVVATLTDKIGVSDAELRFRHEGDTDFKSTKMTRVSGSINSGSWEAILPTLNITGSLEFYIYAKNPSNFNKSAVFDLSVLADLKVINVSFSKEEIRVKDEVKIIATIENNGEVDISGLRVQFFDLHYSVGDLQYIGWISNITIPAQGSADIKVWWLPMAKGEREIKIVLDPENRIQEGDEENNEYLTTVHVKVEEAMGLLTPVPTLADIWFQLTVILLVVAVIGGTILYEKLNKDRPPAPKAGPIRRKGKGGKKKGR